jgi:hypothetical protein
MAATAKHTENTDAILSSGVQRKPLIFETNPFDEERLDDIEFAAHQFDPSYVPGYGEKRNENQLRGRDKKPLLEMPRLQWVRITKKSGLQVTESDEGMLDWLKLGYKACGVDDLHNMGYGFPPTAHVGADGLIRRGDLALFFVGEDRAERNRLRQKRINEEFASREIMAGPTDSVYEVKTDRVRKTGSLRELTKSSELPSLE